LSGVNRRMEEGPIR